MFERLGETDWQNIQKGLTPIDIPNFIRDMLSEDYGAREIAYDSLVKQMLDGYRVGSDVAIAVIPFLIEMLTYEGTPDKSLITSLLVEVGSNINSAKEPYKTHAFRIKQMICDFTDVYASLKAKPDSSLQDDIETLEEICSQRYVR